MIINNECIRDIMFTIEKESSFEHPCRMIGIKNKYPHLVEYGEDTLAYHIRYLKMKELIFNPNDRDDHGFDLTPAGHEFIQNIRDDNNWSKIKKISSVNETVCSLLIYLTKEKLREKVYRYQPYKQL